LALKFCMLAHAEGWRVGFLPKEYVAYAADLDAWQPERPTLIVADYALKRRDAVRVLTERLARRANFLPQPVRLLLIEREGGESFNTQFLGGDSQGVIKPRRYEDPTCHAELALPPLDEDDLWALAEGGRWHAPPRPLSLPRAAFFQRLDGLDQERRPLVAMVLADAAAAEPGRPVFDSLADELRNLLGRDRRWLWPNQLGCIDPRTDKAKAIGTLDADAAIAFATMLDGKGQADFAALEAACGRALHFDFDACAEALGAQIDPHKPHLPALEPDLIGEFFALEVLHSTEPFRGLRYPALGEAAWRQRPDRMADFVRRSDQNFPRHAAVGPLQVPIPGIAESWRLRAYSLLLGPANLDAGIVTVADALREPAAKDAAGAAALAEIAIAVTAQPDEAASPALRLSLLRDVKMAAESHPAEPPVREQWAKIVTNYVNRRAAAEPETCLDLLDALRRLADDHSDEPPLREEWAKTATNYVGSRAAAEPERCLELLDALRRLADDHSDEPPLREQWVRGSSEYVVVRRAEAPEETSTLLDDAAAVVEAYPREDALLGLHGVGVALWLQANCKTLPDERERIARRLARLAEGREAVLWAVLRRHGVELPGS
jgi:hypothetical protein